LCAPPAEGIVEIEFFGLATIPSLPEKVTQEVTLALPLLQALLDSSCCLLHDLFGQRLRSLEDSFL